MESGDVVEGWIDGRVAAREWALPSGSPIVGLGPLEHPPPIFEIPQNPLSTREIPASHSREHRYVSARRRAPALLRARLPT